MDSYYVHLNSEGSTDLFPSNDPCTFVNKLFKPLTLPQHTYEVGVVDIGFKTKEKEFTSYKVKITQYINPEEFIVKKTLSVQGLITQINRQTNPKGATFGPSALTVKDLNKYLYIDQTLAKILGYSQTAFTNGETKAKFERDEEGLKLLPDEHVFVIKLAELKETTYTIEKPTENTYEALIKSINNALKNELGVKFTLGKNKVKIEVPRGYILDLGDLFDGSIINKNTEIPLKPLNGHIIVLLDIVKNQYFNEKAAPYVRIFESSNKKPKLDPVLYFPVFKDYIDTIRVDIVNENLEKPPVSVQRSYITLHFRPK